MHLLPGPGGAKSCSQGREPLVTRHGGSAKPQRGGSVPARSIDVAPPGLTIHNTGHNQGLTALATCLGPSGPGIAEQGRRHVHKPVLPGGRGPEAGRQPSWGRFRSFPEF
jgi:hypothetical protein